MAETLVDIINRKDFKNTNIHILGTDKEYCHRYCSLFYDKEFIKYKDKPVNILEIGVASGGSLILWNDYFTNAEKIIGIELTNSYTEISRNNCKDYSKIQVIQSDAYNEEIVNSLPYFDIIIDDGSHWKEHQIKLLELYCKKINPGGCLIIEDIAEFEYTDIFKTLVPSNMTYEIIDIRKESGGSDGVLFVVRNIQ